VKPIIGIACGQEWRGSRQSLYVHKPYTDAIVKTGGVPVLLPIAEVETEALLSIVDGLLLPGGIDVDPRFYNEEPMARLGQVDLDWDANDMRLCREAMYRDIPILGICRGHQLINVAAGGTLYQDIYTEPKTTLKHAQEVNFYNGIHKIAVKSETLLQEIIEKDEVWVNSSHHQAVKDVAPDFEVAGVASDGIIEAIESKKHNFVLGVQWHPEWMYLKDNNMLKLFIAFINSAAQIGRKKVR
jgi:putative glutamine amidotransferase